MAHIEIVKVNTKKPDDKKSWTVIAGLYDEGSMGVCDLYKMDKFGLVVNIHGNGTVAYNIPGVPFGQQRSKGTKKTKINAWYKIIGLRSMMSTLNGLTEIYCKNAKDITKEIEESSKHHETPAAKGSTNPATKSKTRTVVVEQAGYDNIISHGKVVGKVPRKIFKVTGNKATLLTKHEAHDERVAEKLAADLLGGTWKVVDYKVGGNSPNILWKKGDEMNTMPGRTYLVKQKVNKSDLDTPTARGFHISMKPAWKKLSQDKKRDIYKAMQGAYVNPGDFGEDYIAGVVDSDEKSTVTELENTVKAQIKKMPNEYQGFVKDIIIEDE